MEKAKRYAELCRNDAEARIKSLAITKLVKLYYGIETTAGTKPATFTQLELASSIGGITLDTEQIDVSALEDFITQYAAGRQDTGGTWEVEFIMDPDKSVSQIKTLYSASAEARAEGKATWFEVVFPDMTDAFYVIGECGREVPMPEIAQNEAATMSISIIINEYKGLAAKVVQ